MINILFIADGSLSNPILSSQGIPHIQENSKKEFKYSVMSFEDYDYLDKNPQEKRRYDAAVNELKDYAEVIPVKINLTTRLSTLRIFFYGILNGIRIVKRNKIDIIHGRSNLPSLIGLIIKFFLNIKVVFDNRGLVSDELINKNKLRVKLEIFIEKYLLKNADVIVVVSNAFKKYLTDELRFVELEKKIKVIENSFSDKRFTYSEHLREKQRKDLNLGNKFVMVYAGSSMYWQRFDLVLSAFKLLKKINSKAYLIVLSYDPHIEKIIKESAIDITEFSVFNAKPSDVNQYLISCDIGVISRDDEKRSRVSAPIKFAEYLASGLPVLCSSGVGDTEEMIKEYNVGVIFKNESELPIKLEEIIKLTNEPGIRLRCRKTAEEKLSLTVSAKKYETIYRSFQK